MMRPHEHTEHYISDALRVRGLDSTTGLAVFFCSPNEPAATARIIATNANRSASLDVMIAVMKFGMYYVSTMSRFIRALSYS